MIEIGKSNRLKAIERANHGFYLMGDEQWGDILLPNKYVPEGLQVDDEIDVFIYFDSEDIIIATTLEPLAMVGEFAKLEVVSKEEHGIFLDWGLEKDLFVPFREQIFEMLPGKKYVVFVYIDSSQRIAASTRLTKFIDKSRPPYSPWDEVELLICQKTDLGFKAIVEGRYLGQIFKDDPIHNLDVGLKIKGFIKNIRDDNKIDLSLRPEKGESREELADLIVTRLKESGGFLDVNAKSSAERVNAMFKVSRKKFKIALGYLYKKRIISTDDSGTKLN